MAMKAKEQMTQSRLRSMRSCWRQHHYTYVMQYAPVITPTALWFGTIIHKAIEAYWLARKNNRPEVEWLRVALVALDELMTFEDVWLRAMAMIIAYVFVWNKEDVEVLAVELPFVMPLFNPLTKTASNEWERAGKIDLIIRFKSGDRAGRVAICDHKTSSSDALPTGLTAERLRMDGQATMYLDAARFLGYAPDDIIWDVLHKPKHERALAVPESERKWTKEKWSKEKWSRVTKKNPERVLLEPAKLIEPARLKEGQRLEDESWGDYFERVLEAVFGDLPKYIAQLDVPREAAEVDDFSQDLWEYVQMWRSNTALGLKPRNTDSCRRYGEPCSFISVCERRASLDDPMKFRRKSSAHEELAEDRPAVTGNVHNGVDGEGASSEQ